MPRTNSSRLHKSARIAGLFLAKKNTCQQASVEKGQSDLKTTDRCLTQRRVRGVLIKDSMIRTIGTTSRLCIILSFMKLTQT